MTSTLPPVAAHQRTLAPLLLLILLPLASCFPVDPVKERLEIIFDENGAARVTARVQLARVSQEGAVKDRLSAVRQEYLRQTDPWTHRFQRVEPAFDSYTIEREEGELVAVERSMLIEPAKITDLFYDTGIQLFYTEQNGIAELAIYAGESQRATREQRRAYQELVDGWGDDYAGYIDAMSRVYAYMDEHPERTTLLFANLLDEKSENGEREAVTEEESELLHDASEAMDQVISLFITDEERAWSLEEISLLVNDPFPATVTIQPAGRLLDHEGFDVDEEHAVLRIPRVSLWSAIESLQGRWLSPDPLAAIVEHGRDESVPLVSSETMAGLPRFLAPPRRGGTVWNEVKKGLEIPRTFRASWIVRGRQTDAPSN